MVALKYPTETENLYDNSIHEKFTRDLTRYYMENREGLVLCLMLAVVTPAGITQLRRWLHNKPDWPKMAMVLSLLNVVIHLDEDGTYGWVEVEGVKRRTAYLYASEGERWIGYKEPGSNNEQMLHIDTILHSENT